MPTSPTDLEAAPVLDDPSFPAPEGLAPPEETLELAEDAPLEDIPEPPHESREAALARENAEYRQLLTQMQGQLQQRQPPPQQNYDPYAPLLQGVPAEQQGQWRESFKVLDPATRRIVDEMLEPIRNQQRQIATMSESQALAAKYPAYGQMAGQVEQARWQEFQRTGQWHPLELVYTVAVGAGALQQPQAQRQQRQTQRRRVQGQAAQPTTAENQSARVPAPKRTVDSTLAMSDEEILTMAEKQGGVERLRLPTRRSA